MKSKVFIEELEIGDFVQSVFLATRVQIRETRDGEPYLSLALEDRSGELEARAWEDVEMLASRIDIDDYVALRGEVLEFAGRSYVSIRDIDVVELEDVNEADFYAHSRWPATDLLDQLVVLVSTQIRSPEIKSVLEAVFDDDALMKLLTRAPAAKRNHHAYRGGLLEHCLSMCRLALSICAHYDRYYPGLANSDLVVAGCVLHDIGKCVELDFTRDTRYTTEGQLIGHITTAASWVEKYADRAELEIPESLRIQLKHLILSHHGKLEFGSPVKPQSVEALLLHQVDMIDSRLNMCWNLVQATEDSGEDRWSEYTRAFGGSLHVRGPSSWELVESFAPDDLLGPGLVRDDAEALPVHAPVAENLDLFGD